MLLQTLGSYKVWAFNEVTHSNNSCMRVKVLITPFINAVSFWMPPWYPRTLQLCTERVTIVKASKTRSPSDVAPMLTEGPEKSLTECVKWKQIHSISFQKKSDIIIYNTLEKHPCRMEQKVIEIMRSQKKKIHIKASNVYRYSRNVPSPKQKIAEMFSIQPECL